MCVGGKTGWLALSACLVITSVSCAQDTGTGTSPPPKSDKPAAPMARPPKAEDAQPQVTSSPLGSSSPPVVTLLEPGIEPLRELRLTLGAGQKQSVKIGVTTANSTKVNGRQSPITKIPSAEYTMETEVQEVTGEGMIRYRYGFTDARITTVRGASERDMNRAKRLAEGIPGVAGAALINNRRWIEQANLMIPPGADPDITQPLRRIKHAIEDLWVVFPKEPIGVGGKWQVVMETDTNPNTIRLTQTYTYIVREIEGDTVTLAVTADQEAKRQPYRPPNMAPNASAEVVSLKGEGSGEITLDLKQLMPINARIRTRSETDMEVSFGEVADEWLVNLGVDNRIESIKP